MATDPSVYSIEDQILIAVRVAALAIETMYGPECIRKPGYRSALIEVAVVLKAKMDRVLPAGILCRISRPEDRCRAYDLVSRYVRLPLSASDQVA